MGDAPVAEQIFSGVPGLDIVLQGGFLRGGLYLLAGAPGTGKTILGNQLAFSQVAGGGKVVYVTLLVEAHHRMLVHLQSFRFFDPIMLTDRIYYVSGYHALEQEGFRGLLQLLRKTVHDYQATILVIDGLETAQAYADSELAFKRLLHELHIAMESNDCTTFLLSNDDRLHPAHAIVDGLILMTDTLIGPRAVREIEIRKFRGRAHLRGRHLAEIGDEGYIVHPRTEALHSRPRQDAAMPRVPVNFGVPSMDKMLNGSFLSESITILLGAPGAGKTLLGLSFLTEGARQGEQGLYFGFYETEIRLKEKADRLGLDFRQHIEDGKIDVCWQSAPEDTLDELAQRLLEAVRQHSVRRLFIDGYDGLQRAAIYPERMGRFFNALTNELRSQNVTTLLSVPIEQMFGPVETPKGHLLELVDNMILLRYVELQSQLYRYVSILKGREGLYDRSIREFTITEQGIDVSQTFERGFSSPPLERHPDVEDA
ncbi:MAG: circadian clock protein KaiC [Ardenticatenales bacterium]|nr:circadian clock protein KaiC [Ardenticatenales bacterium]